MNKLLKKEVVSNGMISYTFGRSNGGWAYELIRFGAVLVLIALAIALVAML